MKLNRMITMCAMTAALLFSAGSLLAQNNNGGTNNGGGQNRQNRRGNFDPAQFQQRYMDNVRDQIGFTNDTDWNAIQPLVQKAMDARMAVGFGGRGFGRCGRGGGQGGQGGGGGGFGPPNAEKGAFQK